MAHRRSPRGVNMLSMALNSPITGAPPPPPDTPDDDDFFVPPPPTHPDSSDEENNGTHRTNGTSSDDDGEGVPSPPPAPSTVEEKPSHNRRKSAMRIFDSEINQSFTDLESKMQNPPLIPICESPPSANSPSPSPQHSFNRQQSGSTSQLASPPLSPLSTPSRVPSQSTSIPRTSSNGGTPMNLDRLQQRRGSDFRMRLGSSPLAVNSGMGSSSSGGPMSPTNGGGSSGQYGTLTKAKCLMPGCTAFSARNSYCLRHVWRMSVEELEPLNTKMYQVAKEIVTTEKSYSDGLRIIYKSFLLRITTQNEMMPERPLLDQSELTMIFHNIEDLYKLAENLYLDLEEITLEKVLTTQIGTTLLHYAPQFRIYQTYLENYDDAVKILGQVRKEKQEFDFFCRLQEKCEGMNLESFLIMPVQRLPRYLLLLQELIKRSESATNVPESALQDMTAARDRISNIASSINISLHQKEAQTKVLAIQARFEKDARYQDLATPTRYVIREGPLKKRYGKGSRHITSSALYHFWLFNDILVYADFKKDVIGKGVTYKMKHILPLIGMSIELVDNKGKNKDILITPKHSADAKAFELSFLDTQQRDSWAHDIQQAIDRLDEDSKALKTTSFDGTTPSASNNSSKSSKLKAMMGV